MAERVIAAMESRLHRLPPPPIHRPRRRAGKSALPAPQPVAGKPPTGEIATRQAYGEALVRLGESDPRVRVLDGDVKNSTYAEKFKDRFPERFVEAWIAEQNMVSAAAGLAAQGLVPFASSFACFLTRAADQLRMAAISRSNVKLCGSHAGVSIGEDGASQMALEDLALFRALPEAVVLYPSDGASAEACVQLAALQRGIVYIRTTRMKTPAVYGEQEAFTVGGLKVVRSHDGDVVTVVAAGVTLHEALAAHDELAASGVHVRVVDLYSVKPVDAAGLLPAARRTRHRLLVVADPYAEGGLADALRAALVPEPVARHPLALSEPPPSSPPKTLL